MPPMKLNWYRVMLRGERPESVVLVDEDPRATYVQAPSEAEALAVAATRAQVLKHLFGVENGELADDDVPAAPASDVN